MNWWFIFLDFTRVIYKDLLLVNHKIYLELVQHFADYQSLHFMGAFALLYA